MHARTSMNLLFVYRFTAHSRNLPDASAVFPSNGGKQVRIISAVRRLPGKLTSRALNIDVCSFLASNCAILCVIRVPDLPLTAQHENAKMKSTPCLIASDLRRCASPNLQNDHYIISSRLPYRNCHSPSRQAWRATHSY